MSKRIRSFQQSFAVPNPPSRLQQSILIRRNASTNPRELLLRYHQPGGLTGLLTPPNHNPSIHTPAHQAIPPPATTNTPVRIRAHSVGLSNSANADATQPETVQSETESESESETEDVQSEIEVFQPETETETEPEPKKKKLRLI
ncbi:Protein of unknown function [Pyronema omphalodes CBS 100304]|uniref:Uncharacterized protein n=1 Tax=Pyronema omphalodes (strain CBS 100304) TaxID=1076935 RepID=U4KWX5_PYROM|nr:Protein of unknown function [Pyronema omphalodes CBS 100304]